MAGFKNNSLPSGRSSNPAQVGLPGHAGDSNIAFRDIELPHVTMTKLRGICSAQIEIDAS
jgi:hypothetical protein